MNKKWFINQYGDILSGTVIKNIDNYYQIKLDIGGTMQVLKEVCHNDYTACYKAMKDKSEKIIAEYEKEIITIEDLVCFMWNHQVALCEEYTDWEARTAASNKAKEFGVDLEK